MTYRYWLSRLFLFWFVLISWETIAQIGQLSVRIWSSAQEPAVQAHIVVKGSKQSAITDSAGYFTMTTIPAGTYLIDMSTDTSAFHLVLPLCICCTFTCCMLLI
jgi:hypothetical protein